MTGEEVSLMVAPCAADLTNRQACTSVYGDAGRQLDPERGLTLGRCAAARGSACYDRAGSS
eukprot:10790-Eustigmatos_ZCMA.PRE.1